MTWTPNLLDTRCGLLPPSAMLQAPCDWRDLPRGHQITPSPRREAVDESSPERYRDDNHETAPPPPVGGRRLQLQKPMALPLRSESMTQWLSIEGDIGAAE
jgi:hypothetical protein